jgi:hypothetical protein
MAFELFVEVAEGFRVQGSGFRVQGSGFRVQGRAAGFRFADDWALITAFKK